MSTYGIAIDSDDWCVMRAAELRSKGEPFSIRIMVKDEIVVDCCIVRNGKVERPSSPRVMPGGWEAYCLPQREER